ncbi:hypothetical protein HO173_004180 [Letharia columbiana]|uniref:Uncharacterized protein n=1 Tax=Letharia columbiana TaxID=112416 RepID=A0A8H6G028_9LECA|nr:uncharacterized protein HO173_004180 [Letharia columbiana]KAF6237979.1 hypothetical protein HO173_004180 [Letharia columbiana]
MQYPALQLALIYSPISFLFRRHDPCFDLEEAGKQTTNRLIRVTIRLKRDNDIMIFGLDPRAPLLQSPFRVVSWQTDNTLINVSFQDSNLATSTDYWESSNASPESLSLSFPHYCPMTLDMLSIHKPPHSPSKAAVRLVHQ